LENHVLKDYAHGSVWARQTMTEQRHFLDIGVLLIS
jgi:hypothetical protein